MAEEFDESEVVFSDEFSSVLQLENKDENRVFGSNGERNKTRSMKKTTEKVLSSSLPVNIPENMFRRYVGKEEDDYSGEEKYSEGGGGEIVPPHIIVGRRIQGEQMAFSVCSGSGRTLKGRDLSRVRNSVLRLTGFLEA
ncbi:Protein S40-1 [Cardamine amara subsp. amara]|uniref:Protein S40-1 n=1 Tax=Cardamine amara subsp. amara TaxID=228776 RepID=A0ABD1AKN8_CARAN